MTVSKTIAVATPTCETLRSNSCTFTLAVKDADYDHTYEPDKIDAEKAIERARTGIDCLSQARTTNPDQVQMMCVNIIASDTQRKHMRGNRAR